MEISTQLNSGFAGLKQRKLNQPAIFGKPIVCPKSQYDKRKFEWTLG